MIIKLITMLFGILIGKLPQKTKDELRARGKQLLLDAIKASAEGAVRGTMKK